MITKVRGLCPSRNSADYICYAHTSIPGTEGRRPDGLRLVLRPVRERERAYSSEPSWSQTMSPPHRASRSVQNPGVSRGNRWEGPEGGQEVPEMGSCALRYGALPWITKTRYQAGISAGTYFSLIWSLGSLRSHCQHSQVLVKALFLDCRFLAISSHRGE